MAREKLLIVDDEPHYLEWLEEYIVNLGYDVVFVETANRAVEIGGQTPFRAIVFDLNIPITGALMESATAKGGLYLKFPGLYLAWVARTAGFRSKQTIVYSVHSLDEIEAECRKLSCTYISKGRPAIFKQELKDVLSYDPTKDRVRTAKGQEGSSGQARRARTSPPRRKLT